MVETENTQIETDEIFEENEVNGEVSSEFAEIEEKVKSGIQLTDDELDTIADVYIDIIKHVLVAFDAEDSEIDEYINDDGQLIFDVLNSNLAVLIGRHGKTLDAFHQLVISIANHRLGFRYPALIDVESYKSRQRQRIESVAQSTAQKVVDKQTSMKLKPMNPYERRLVHMILRDFNGVETSSEGEDPMRRVVIKPSRN